jgi:hypothetical protein
MSLAAFLPFVLSGCFKFTMDLEVSSQDTISGTAVVALSKELQAFADESGGGGEPTDAFSDVEGVEVIEFDDGSFVGQQYEFDAIPIEELSLSDDSSALTITRDGDNLVVSGNLSFEDEGADPEAADDLGFGQAFFDSADLRISIAFPGEILETNGDVDEETNTITWIPKYGETNELSAVVYAPRGVPVWVWWMSGSVLALAGIISLGIFLTRSRRARSSEQAELPGGAESVSSSVKKIYRQSERPVYEYKVRTGLISGEFFHLRLFEDEVVFEFGTGSRPASESPSRLDVSDIENVSTLDGKAGLGVRLVHHGRVHVLPAKSGDAETLAGLIRSLKVDRVKAPEEKNQDKPNQGKLSDYDDAASNKAAGPRSGSVADDIREYGRLLEEGLITAAEFSQMKQKRISEG